MFNRDEYTNAALQQEHSDEFIEETISYASNLVSQNLPVIFSTFHLSIILGISFDDLKRILNKREDSYAFWEIKKKSGGMRQIIAPFKTLRYIQVYVNTEILSKVAVHERATGFIKGKSIATNASYHKSKRAILNIDLVRFFDCINERRVYGIFHSLGYSKQVSVDLAKLTTVKLPDEYFASLDYEETVAYRKLISRETAVTPQGAPTSPALSNLVLRRLDKRLSALGVRQGVEYSRYADDITFSGDLENLPRINLIRSIIEEEGFMVNWNKVRIARKGRRQQVTGLTVNEKIYVSKKLKKEVKDHIYGCLNFGVDKHMAFRGIDQGLFKEWLLGKIFFIHSVEPQRAAKMLTDFNRIIWPL